ncbi:MAG: hypothetical protein HN368_12185, partial [Spirochaetales bacterium]|nr:hypothetical protein [Spirochaetales bacterium]
PNGVAALVSRIDNAGITIELVNIDPLADKKLTVLAGAFGEHRFTKAVREGLPPVNVDGPSFRVEIGPGASAKIDVGLHRFAGIPGYVFPDM